jgi:hypothetical protein
MTQNGTYIYYALRHHVQQKRNIRISALIYGLIDCDTLYM